MLSPQQLHLNSLMWSTGKGAGYISPMSFHRRNSPATTSNTESVHFLSDTTALLRDTIALPKWKQQLLFLLFSPAVCVFYCQVFSNIPFEMTKLHKLWRDRKAFDSHLPLLEAWFAFVDCSGLLCHAQYGFASPGAIPFPCQRCKSSFFSFS